MTDGFAIDFRFGFGSHLTEESSSFAPALSHAKKSTGTALRDPGRHHRISGSDPEAPQDAVDVATAIIPARAGVPDARLILIVRRVGLGSPLWTE